MDPHAIDEIVFVGMRPFYGLNVYLDKHVEGVEIGERRFEYSKFVTHEDLCAELAGRRALGLRAQAAATAAKFIATAQGCGWQGRSDRVSARGR